MTLATSATGANERRPLDWIADAYLSAVMFRERAQSMSADKSLMFAVRFGPMTSPMRRRRSATTTGWLFPCSSQRCLNRPRATEWNVPAMMVSRNPRARRRRRNSLAAWRVKVKTATCEASAVSVKHRYATRRVRTPVLPDPAPAMTARRGAPDVIAAC